MSTKTVEELSLSTEDVVVTDSSFEIHEDDWDYELTRVVAENADVIVKCPWLDDAETPLGAAMLNIQVQISEENVDTVLSLVHQMLENNAEEEVVGDETEETTDSSNTETKEKEPQKDDGSSGPEIKSKDKVASVVEAKDRDVDVSELAGNDAPVPDAPDISERPTPLKTPKKVAVDIIKPGTSSVAAKPPASKLNTAKIAKKDGVKPATKKQATLISAAPTITQKPLFIPPVQEKIAQIEEDQVIPEVADAENSETISIHTSITIDGSGSKPEQITTDNNLEVSTNIAEIQADPGDEADEHQQDQIAAIVDMEHLSNQQSIDYQDEELVVHVDEDMLAQTDEELITLADSGIESDVYEAALEPVLIESDLNTSEVEPIQIDAEIEETIPLIIEQIESSDIEIVEDASRLVDNIIEIAEIIEIDDEKPSSQEELEELYIELFDLLNINYTPEKIAAFARGTIDDRVSRTLTNESDEEANTSSRLVLKKLKKIRDFIIPLTLAYKIGRSILHLCKLTRRPPSLARV